MQYTSSLHRTGSTMASGWLAQLEDELTSQLEDALTQRVFNSGAEVRLGCII